MGTHAPCRLLVLTGASDIGGAERQLLHLLPGLRERGWTIRVLSLVGSGAFTERLLALGIEAENVGGSTARHGPRITAVVQSFRPAVVYLFGQRTQVFGGIAAKGCGARVAAAIRSTEGPGSGLRRTLDRVAGVVANLWISNSEAGKIARIADAGVAPDRIVVIRNGVELPDLSTRARLRGEFRGEWHIPTHAPLIGMIANYRQRKGHHAALEGFSIFRGQFPEARMLFAGDDYLGGEIQRAIAAQGLEGAVLALPFLKDPSPAYAAMDLFLLASEYEGTPNTLLEAMSWGVPSVATRSGGTPEVLREEDGGVLVEVGDSTAMAEGLLELWRSPALRTEAARRHRARVEFSFPIPRMIEEHDRVLGELVGMG